MFQVIDFFDHSMCFIALKFVYDIGSGLNQKSAV